jgi:hypothetical protein
LFSTFSFYVTREGENGKNSHPAAEQRGAHWRQRKRARTLDSLANSVTMFDVDEP